MAFSPMTMLPFLVPLMSDLGFYRTELRVIQNTAKSNEEFLTQVAALLSKSNEKSEREKMRADMAEEKIRILERGD